MGVLVRERKKGDGNWQVRISHTYRRKTISVRSEKEGKKLAEKIRARLVLGQELFPETVSLSACPKLKDYYEDFKSTYIETALKHTTREGYSSSFKVHILPALGKYPLDKIDRPTMEQFVSSLVKKGLAKNSIKQVLAALGVMFSNAIERGIVDRNPAKGLGKLYRMAPMKHDEIQPLSEEEVGKFLESVQKNAPQCYAIFLMAIHTGMRSGELAGLQWGDIDWNRKSATVRRNFTHGRLTSTKTGKSRRVDLSNAVIHELGKLKKRQKEEWLKKGINKIPDWVFSSTNGTPIDMKNLKNRQFRTCLEKAGLRRIRFHDLRHSFSTILIQNGESIVYVQNQLGHSTIRMTIDVYTHWIPSENRDAVNRLPVAAGGAC